MSIEQELSGRIVELERIVRKQSEQIGDLREVVGALVNVITEMNHDDEEDEANRGPGRFGPQPPQMGLYN